MLELTHIRAKRGGKSQEIHGNFNSLHFVLVPDDSGKMLFTCPLIGENINVGKTTDALQSIMHTVVKLVKIKMVEIWNEIERAELDR